MSQHRALIEWRRETPDFAYETYSRSHKWEFPGGAVLAASSAPEYGGEPERVDPEEAFVAAVSACHMLTFLAIAAKKRLVVDSYTDHAVGLMEKNENGKTAITQVTLRPEIAFGGESPSPEELGKIHEKAHANCFIANSVKTAVTVE